MTTFRWDKFITVNIIPIVRRARGISDPPEVPILMYHSISAPDERISHPYYETKTSPQVFEGHMKYLYENGYSAIGLNELPSVTANGGKSGRSVVLTFDDGYRDFLVNAIHILEKYHFKATVFLPTGWMGTRSGKFDGKDLLNWEDVRGLRNRGVYFGSHTINHWKLKNLPLEEVENEIGESKKEIEDRLGEPVDSFSYPYAFPEGNLGFLDKYFEILERCGYRVGVTTVIGRVAKGDNLLALKRLPVNDYDDLVFFKAKLDGAYDWVHRPQYLRKKYFGWIGK